MTRFAIVISVVSLCCFGAASTAFAQGNNGKPRFVSLSIPPDGVITGSNGPASAAVQIFGPQDLNLNGNFGGLYPESISYNVSNLACLTPFYTLGLSQADAANEFYAIYLTIGDFGDGENEMRLQIFNTGCSSGGGPGFAGSGNFSSLVWLQSDNPIPDPPALEGLFTDSITIQVKLEGSTRAGVVLSGSDPAP